jgi:hypothetical protein
MGFAQNEKIRKPKNKKCLGEIKPRANTFDFDFWCLTPLSAILQPWRPVLVVEEAGENRRPWASNNYW